MSATPVPNRFQGSYNVAVGLVRRLLLVDPFGDVLWLCHVDGLMRCCVVLRLGPPVACVRAYGALVSCGHRSRALGGALVSSTVARCLQVRCCTTFALCKRLGAPSCCVAFARLWCCGALWMASYAVCGTPARLWLGARTSSVMFYLCCAISLVRCLVLLCLCVCDAIVPCGELGTLSVVRWLDFSVLFMRFCGCVVCVCVVWRAWHAVMVGGGRREGGGGRS